MNALPYSSSMSNYLNHPIVWGNCGLTLKNKLQKLQNRAACALTYSNYDVDAGHL